MTNPQSIPGNGGVRSTLASIGLVDRVPSLVDLRPEPIKWLVNRFAPEQTLILFAGTYGSMKSFVALDLAFAVGSGGEFANCVTQRRPVLYLDRENGRGLIARRLDSMGILGDPALANVHYWGNWVPLKLTDVACPQLLEWAEETRGLMVFDSLVRFHRANENAASEMAPVMEKFIALRDAGATIVVLHHASKNKENNFRGSEEIAGSCDLAYRFTKESPGHVKLEQFKNRDGAETLIRVKLDYGRFAWVGGEK